MKIDLHVHTEESDGALSVAEILRLAWENGVNVLAITDHESTQGIEEAQKLSLSYQIKIIPGVELLTYFQGREIHLLGYYKNTDNEHLQKRLKELREKRTTLAYDMVKRLQLEGFSIQWRDVEREASADGAVSKAHIMRALYHRDLVLGRSGQEILGYFQPGGIAYLPFLHHPYEEAVDLIYETGGLPVLAHPGLLHDQKLVLELLACRRTGLEVYYGYWYNREELIKEYAKLARTHAILATGGSDYHGSFSQVQIGQLDIPDSIIKELENYLHKE